MTSFSNKLKIAHEIGNQKNRCHMDERTFRYYVESKLDSFVEAGEDWRPMSNMERFYHMHSGHSGMHEGLFLMSAMDGKGCLRQLVKDYKNFLTPEMFVKLASDKDSLFHKSQHSSTKNYFNWLHEWEQSMSCLDALSDEELERLMDNPTYEDLLNAGFTRRCSKYADSWNSKLLREEKTLARMRL